MNLKIDNREKKSRIESARRFFEDLDYTVKVGQLPVADYVFEDKVAVEFKTPSDMIHSIMNNRIFHQVERMKQYPFSFVLVVGDVAEEINNRNKLNYWNRKNQLRSFTVNSWLGALARLEVETKVISVDNNQQAWTVLDFLVRKLLADNPKVRRVANPKVTLSDPIATFLSGIYVNDSQRIGIKTAVMIREYLHLESLRDLLDVTEKDLLKVKGVGKQTASAIMKVI